LIAFEPQRIALGGLEWTLPRLPWRVSRTVQAHLMAVMAAVGGGAVSEDRIATLDLASYDRLAEAIYLTTTAAIAGPKLERAQFDELPFGLSELFDAFRAAAVCCGMQVMAAGDPAGPKAPSSTGTS
jgi:hypothetical protein